MIRKIMRKSFIFWLVVTIPIILVAMIWGYLICPLIDATRAFFADIRASWKNTNHVLSEVYSMPAYELWEKARKELR